MPHYVTTTQHTFFDVIAPLFQQESFTAEQDVLHYKRQMHVTNSMLVMMVAYALTTLLAAFILLVIDALPISIQTVVSSTCFMRFCEFLSIRIMGYSCSSSVYPRASYSQSLNQFESNYQILADGSPITVGIIFPT